MRIAFVVPAFPSVTETFIINQVADLLDRGVDVEIFAFNRGSADLVSSRFSQYNMRERTHYLEMPRTRLGRCLGAIVPAIRIGGGAFVRWLRGVRSGELSWPLHALYAAALFAGREFDLVHCHFGTVAVEYLAARTVLATRTPFVTTLYGFDVSFVFKSYPPDFYDRLKRDCPLFFVMSEDMKRRVEAGGFPEENVKVLPVGIDVESYPFAMREYRAGEPVEILSVGRFVEKKGFDDLLKALAAVRKRSTQPFRCSIVGGGRLEHELRALSSSLGLDDCVSFKGVMRIDEILRLLPRTHILAAASKTAPNGDME
jgi:colanic acid/amylovoran biosynthesis glycosyltransferase